MTKYTVHMTAIMGAGVTVDAEDAQAAIEAAMEKGVPEICAQCSGWGKSWYKEDADEWSEISVTSDAGDAVWEGPDLGDTRAARELQKFADQIRTEHPDIAAKLDERANELTKVVIR